MVAVQRCLYCGRYYRPDPRVGSRQKACSDLQCKAKRKQQAQQSWLEDNPGYFKGRYEYVKEQRQKRRAAVSNTSARPAKVIQDKIPPAKPYQSWTLLIPAPMADKIQDEILLVRRDSTTFVAAGP